VAAFVPDVGESMYTIRGVPVPDSVEGLFERSRDPRAEFYADVPGCWLSGPSASSSTNCTGHSPTA
jgi:hypothetical protein